MARIRINLDGDRVLKAKLSALTDSEAKKAILGACREAIKIVQKEAQTLAPSKTGALRRSLKVRAIRRSRSRIGMRVTTSKTDNLYAGKTFYAAFQEFGWKTGSRKNEEARVAKKIDKDLRRQSPGSGSPAEATRRAKFIAGEGKRQAAAKPRQERKQIQGKHFMKRAADTKREAALEMFRMKIDEHIRKVMAKRK
jgi:HK97 gp10 family phage protein